MTKFKNHLVSDSYIINRCIEEWAALLINNPDIRVRSGLIRIIELVD